jgi:hypothetical protein
MSKKYQALKTAAQLDAEIAAALGKKSREESIRKLVRRAIRGLGVKDGVAIQERVERIVHIANKSGPRIGIQGDLSRVGDDGLEVWLVEGGHQPILGIEIESGAIVFR